MTNIEQIRGAWLEFSACDEDDPALAILTEGSDIVSIEGGHSLFSQTDPAGPVFLVVSGRFQSVRYSKNGHEIWLSEIGPGALIGELAVLGGRSRSSDIIALETSQTLRVHNLLFERAIKASGQFGYSVARLLSERVRNTSTQLEELMSLETGGRLHAELLRLSVPSDDDEAFLIKNVPKVSDLAVRIHTTRETASRELSKLIKRGLVRREKEGLIIIAPNTDNWSAGEAIHE